MVHLKFIFVLSFVFGVALCAPLNVAVHQQNNTANTPAPTVALPVPSNSPGLAPSVSAAPSESFVPSESAAPSLSFVPSESSAPSESFVPSESPAPSVSASTSATASASLSTSPSSSNSLPSPSVSGSALPGSSKSVAPSTIPTPSVSMSASVSASISPSASVTPSVGSSQSSAPTLSATPSIGASLSAGATPASENTTPGGSEVTDPTPLPAAPPRPCFPGSATVSLEGGETKRMEELSVGDRVAVGGGLYSEVFMFTHKLSNIKYEFVSIRTKSGARLRLTEGHYLPVNGAYVPASKAKLGDTVVLADGTSSNIVDVKRVQDVGLYNPQTTQGDIIVNGIRASTYTTAVELKMAHALLAPLRFACDRFGIRTSLLEAGADSVAEFTSRFA